MQPMNKKQIVNVHFYQYRLTLINLSFSNSWKKIKKKDTFHLMTQVSFYPCYSLTVKEDWCLCQLESPNGKYPKLNLDLKLIYIDRNRLHSIWHSQHSLESFHPRCLSFEDANVMSAEWNTYILTCLALRSYCKRKQMEDNKLSIQNCTYTTRNYVRYNCLNTG